jgi:hypothetical protein
MDQPYRIDGPAYNGARKCHCVSVFAAHLAVNEIAERLFFRVVDMSQRSPGWCYLEIPNCLKPDRAVAVLEANLREYYQVRDTWSFAIQDAIEAVEGDPR